MLQAIRKRISAALAGVEFSYGTVAVLVALVLAGFATYSAWHFALNAAEDQARIRFEFRASQIDEAIRGRMVDYEQVLRGGVGLFAASASVGRTEWRAYVEHLRIESIYPGIQGIGFVLRVPASQKDQHERSVRAQGYPSYAIQPPGERAEYTSIIYLEPFSDRNLRAFGYDMYSEPVRRAAMERARDGGEPAISGKVTLIQESDRDVQAGFLMYVPVYRYAMDIATVEHRRAALMGYVFSPFRVNDLMRGIFGKLEDVRVRIIDNATAAADKLLYDSSPASAATGRTPQFRSTTKLSIRGSDWMLYIDSRSAFEKTIDRKTPRLVATATGFISLLVLAVIVLLATLRARAVKLASAMTRELRESRERLALAIEGSGQALFDWDVTTGKVVLSDQWSRITGGGSGANVVTTAELVAMVHPDDVAMVRQRIADLIAGALHFYRVEHRVRTVTGEWRWISSRAKVVERDAAGRALRVAGTNVDITDRKEIERLKNEFVSTVSHELRTPLTAIVGALGLLRRAAGKLPPEAETFLGMAERNSERLTVLINNILDIEKIESGRMDFRIVRIAVLRLLEHAVALNASYADKFGVRLEQQVAPELAVSGDEDRLLQVLTNLISNAVKFAPAGSAVTVSAAVRDGQVRIAVTDRGPGVPEEFRDRIFEKFAQADGSDTRRKGGTGLGLSISKAIIEELGGTIGYESAPGGGATFHFELPLQA